MKYLTRAYVESLGLNLAPIDKGHDPTMYCCALHAPPYQRIVDGVQFDGRLYEREAGGGFVRLGR